MPVLAKIEKVTKANHLEGISQKVIAFCWSAYRHKKDPRAEIAPGHL